ncbi:hypothetical protein [Lacinutrix jangbogonensis]|uniref:hypothetical protein n=1 Tax=Lacinutrix jangbogonensis TaxID=1469557 RepID=UPI00053E3EE4|nr:hypothetical protein [Lacinutrix jangbogonensis]
MKNQSTLLSLSIFIAFSFNNCKDSNESALNSKDTAQLELVDQNMKPGKAESDYYYGIGSRFEAISKTDLDNATTIYPFNRDHENERIEKINSTEIIIIENDRRTDRREYGRSENLTDGQKALFKSLDYSKHFSMKTLFKEKTTENIVLDEQKFNPHYTVVPEIEAFYIEGEDAIINYLIENSRVETLNLDSKKVRAAKIYFKISKKGTLKNVYMERTTGYPILNTKLIELISTIPGQWEPAKNSNGEIVEQEFAFTFGPKDGC